MHSRGELKIDAADAVEITSRILCDTKVVSAMLYNANYSFEYFFFIKSTDKRLTKVCALPSFWFSLLYFAGISTSSAVCAINIAFYGVDSAHNLIVDVTHLEVSRNKEVMRGESIHMGFMSIEYEIYSYVCHSCKWRDRLQFPISLKMQTIF